jgi:DNA-binding transcriptional ArsR family regulator
MNRRPKRALLQVWVGQRQNPQLLDCLESPTDAEILDQLQRLPGGDQISTVELHISKTHHIAVGGSVSEGFYARYHEFSRAGEWESVRDDLSVELAAKLVAAYRDQASDWKKVVDWKRRTMTSDLEDARKEREFRESA